MYHSKEAAVKAEEEFDKIFVKKGIPDEMPEMELDHSEEITLLDLIMKAEFAPSRGEARRLITQGGVSIDGEKITDAKYSFSPEKDFILKVGKRKFMKVIVK